MEQNEFCVNISILGLSGFASLDKRKKEKVLGLVGPDSPDASLCLGSSDESKRAGNDLQS